MPEILDMPGFQGFMLYRHMSPEKCKQAKIKVQNVQSAELESCRQHLILT